MQAAGNHGNPGTAAPCDMCCRTLLLLLVFLSVAAQAGGDSDRTDIVFAAETLSARDNWTLNRRTDYRFVLHRSCYCASPNDVRIEVRDGRITEVVDLASGTPLDPKLHREYPTVDELFTQIDAAIVRKPDSMHVEYDRHLGFPARVAIDFSYRMADEEIGYTIEDMELL